MPPTVSDWLEGKDILITGGTGFIGKALIYKLLTACPKVNHLYLIVRSKRGTEVQDRKQEFSKHVVFESIFKTDPNAFDKVTFIAGDMSEFKLGLSEDDQEMLKEKIHIVFHTAATVRFDEPLSAALKLNTRGTYELTELAKQMKRLELFEYVSTTYCNANRNETILEQVYTSHLDWKVMLKVLETDESAVDLLVNKLLWTQPNTYTLTKCMAENVVLEASEVLPAVIVRPSVVVPSLKEPIPGWTDNLNGVVGVTVGVSKGVLRVFKCAPEASLDYVPVDITVNGIITAAWAKRFSENGELEVFNQAYGNNVPLSFQNIVKNGITVNEKYPMENYCWFPFMLLTNNTYLYHVLFYVLQLIPALLQDILLTIMGQKRMLLKLNIKIYNAAMALSDFSAKPFKFVNTKYDKLNGNLDPVDRELFTIWMDASNLDPLEVMFLCQLGIKKYFFNEKDEDLPRYRRNYKILYYIDRCTRAALVVFVAWQALRMGSALQNFVWPSSDADLLI